MLKHSKVELGPFEKITFLPPDPLIQTYFTDKWLERKQYSVTMAKQSQFKEAALLAQETAAAEE